MLKHFLQVKRSSKKMSGLEAGVVTERSESDGEDSNEDVAEIPQEFSWIKVGENLQVSYGEKKIVYVAKAVSAPVYDRENEEWVVSVRYDRGRVYVVECFTCFPLPSGRPTRERKKTLLNATVVTPTKKARRYRQYDDLSVSPFDDDSESKPAASVDSEKKHEMYEAAFSAFSKMPGLKEDEVKEALEAVGYPYGSQSVMQEINLRRMAGKSNHQEIQAEFEVQIGMIVKKHFDDGVFFGRVTKEVEESVCSGYDEPKKAWQVRYYDGDTEDMDEEELKHFCFESPKTVAPCRGRKFQMLELFCGKAVVTEEFYQRKWRVISIDNATGSNATIKADILGIEPADLPFVPDFIWASPPCQTYSRMAYGVHRNPSSEEWEKTAVALEHNHYFHKMTEIMYFTKSKHNHAIVVIENPVGSLKDMPLMKEFVKNFNLFETTVHYCAFGRDELKPTNLWTNDRDLALRLSMYKCTCRERHRVGVQQAGHRYDFSAIPQPLAEEVAEYIDSKFVLNHIRQHQAQQASM